MNEEFSKILRTPYAEMLATGFGFTEGPVWAEDGFIYFVDIQNSRQLRWSRKTGTEIVRTNTGEGNGTTFDTIGRMVMCEGGNRQVTVRTDPHNWSPLVDNYQGKSLNRPNDVICNSNGTIYFTDPAGRLPENEKILPFSGVFMFSPSNTLSIATDECEYPNGLAFSPDEKLLYVSISRLNEKCIEEKQQGLICEHQFIRVFDVNTDGTLGNNRIFANMSSSDDGVPDGMKVDKKGRVFCTGPGGCWVFNPDGTRIGIIKLPEVPANLAFGGPSWTSLYFTARTSIYLMETYEPGIAVW